MSLSEISPVFPTFPPTGHGDRVRCWACLGRKVFGTAQSCAVPACGPGSEQGEFPELGRLAVERENLRLPVGQVIARRDVRVCEGDGIPPVRATAAGSRPSDPSLPTAQRSDLRVIPASPVGGWSDARRSAPDRVIRGHRGSDRSAGGGGGASSRVSAARWSAGRPGS